MVVAGIVVVVVVVGVTVLSTIGYDKYNGKNKQFDLLARRAANLRRHQHMPVFSATLRHGCCEVCSSHGIYPGLGGPQKNQSIFDDPVVERSRRKFFFRTAEGVFWVYRSKRPHKQL